MSEMEKGLVIIRPTERCNLSCRYCYSMTSSDVAVMEDQVLDEAMEKILRFYRQVTFVWHGGESTFVGLNFFRRAMELQKKYRISDQKIINEIQTNGTLIDEDWAQFFKEHSFFVGVSIDGPKDINDAVRIGPDASGTFERTMNGVTILRKQGISVAGICVIAKHNVGSIDRVLDFYEDQDIPLNINPFISSGQGSIFADQLLITPNEFSRAMINIFDRWFENPTIKIYDFYKIIRSFFTGINNICCYSGKCSSEYISVCPNGDVYPCGRWAGEKKFLMGNIMNETLSEIVHSRPAHEILGRGEFLDECRDCQWLEICNGGCPHTSFLYTGSIYHCDFYCKGRKELFAHIYGRVREELEVSRKSSLVEISSGFPTVLKGGEP